MAIVSSIFFTSQDPLYAHEKPYFLKFSPPHGLPKTNVKSDSCEQILEDIRGRENDFSLAKNGFVIAPIRSELSYDEFNDDEKIKRSYLPQVAHMLENMLGAFRVQIFEYLVRKRHVSFPVATGEVYSHYQPTTTAHIDMTSESAKKMAEKLNHMIGLDTLPSQNYQFLNVWRPLRGPVKDWPLALCDNTTLVPASLLSGDVVFEDLEMENTLVHFHNEQKWYYISEQMPEEAWIFVQADRRPDKVGMIGVPHSSFHHPDSTEKDLTRESIEVRALVFYNS